MEQTESKILIDKINSLEHQIENIKKQLNDSSVVDDLTRRIANCENLAGIQCTKQE